MAFPPRLMRELNRIEKMLLDACRLHTNYPPLGMCLGGTVSVTASTPQRPADTPLPQDVLEHARFNNARPGSLPLEPP